jgi:uncharacterized protein with von Willebrand factor type A (vWA) domain
MEKLQGAIERLDDQGRELGRVFDSEALERTIREALEKSRRSQEQAFANLRDVWQQGEGAPLDVWKQIEEAKGAVAKSLSNDQWRRSLKEDLSRKLQGDYAEALREKAEKARETTEKTQRNQLQQLQRHGEAQAEARARRMEEAMRQRLRSKRADESESLKRSHDEIDRLRRRVEELEREIETLNSKNGVRSKNV